MFLFPTICFLHSLAKFYLILDKLSNNWPFRRYRCSINGRKRHRHCRDYGKWMTASRHPTVQVKQIMAKWLFGEIVQTISLQIRQGSRQRGIIWDGEQVLIFLEFAKSVENGHIHGGTKYWWGVRAIRAQVIIHHRRPAFCLLDF